MKSNYDAHLLHLVGGADVRVNITHICRFALNIPSKPKDSVLSRHIICKAPNEFYYIGTSVFMKNLKAQKMEFRTMCRKWKQCAYLHNNRLTVNKAVRIIRNT